MGTTQSTVNGGKLLASLRQKAGLTQTELASRAQLSRSMVAQLEIGERRPSRKLLRSICDAMSITPEDEQQLLLSYEFTPSGETPEQIAAYLRADKNLSQEQAERIMDLVRAAYNREISGQGAVE